MLTHAHRFNYSLRFWHRKPLAWGKVRIESDARSTMCPGQNDIHFPFTVRHLVVTARRLCFHQRVSSFVCLLASRIMQKLLHRFSQKFGGKAAHGPMKKRLDFVDNPDQDPGIFWMTYATAVLAMVKAPHSGFDSSVKIHRLADLRLNEL